MNYYSEICKNNTMYDMAYAYVDIINTTTTGFDDIVKIESRLFFVLVHRKFIHMYIQK